MEIVNLFGEKLAEITGKGTTLCSGLILLAIKDAGKNPYNLSYQDFKSTLNNYLSKRLITLGNVNAGIIIGDLMVVLNEKQSLFTISVR